MTKLLTAALTGMALAASLAVSVAWAGDKKPLGVIELFTSQGCNSCPPADAVLADLADDGRVIALGYHVDYWDYLGWKDTLGSKKNTERQESYVPVMPRVPFLPSVKYTPQAILNGRTHVNGGNQHGIVGSLAQMRSDGEGLMVDINVRRENGSVVIETGGMEGGRKDAHLLLVFFQKNAVVDIKRGENHGKTIRYVNSVTGIQTQGMWHGQQTSFEMPESELEKQGDGCAVLLQIVSKAGIPGPIIGAAMIPDA